jgi:hypothetical protein
MNSSTPQLPNSSTFNGSCDWLATLAVALAVGAPAFWSALPRLNAAAASEPSSGRAVAEWVFTRDGDLQGWQPNGHLREVKVAGGALSCRAEGGDPILELRPLLDLAASPWQMIEVRLKADRAGPCEFFWSNTTEGRYGGFAQEKTTRFNVLGDGQWHTYRLLPFWHPEKKIIRLRFDLYDATQFALAHIRICELAVPAPVERADFDFDQGPRGWQALAGARFSPGAAGLGVSLPAPDSFLLAPPLGIGAAVDNFLSLRLAAEGGQHATLLFATEQEPGLQTLSFPIQADGREHIYNLDLLAVPGWRGRIIALGLGPGAIPTEARLCWLKVSADPQGPPQLKVRSFALEDTFPRAGNPARLAALVTNEGGQTATNVQAALTVPENIRILSASPDPGEIARLGFGEEALFAWSVRSDEPLTGAATLRVTCGDLAGRPAQHTNDEDAALACAPLSFLPRLDLPRADYVPEPKPVRGAIEVGVYYFPGWKTAGQWQPIRPFPERKPVLGWYREGDPEVADWHIKWAVEHGITFFVYDWYWSKGTRQLEHALHDGYFRARYRHLLKFCLLWANHNPPHTSSYEDCLAVTRSWIEKYFRRPEHLTCDGQPVMIIFSPHRLTEDLGSPGVKRAFDAMRAECRQAGLKGLYFVACVGNPGQARDAAVEGYDAVTAYNWPGLGMTGGGNYAPFELLLNGYRQNWEQIRAHSPIPLQPVPVCGGWDSRPWHGDNNLVRFGRTPELFEQHLRDAKRFLDMTEPRSPTARWILVEAWNEWGEGSYIEPHKEFGFGYLDAVRKVFTSAPEPHLDLTPADVDLGPYDLPPPDPGLTRWDFDGGDQGWNNTMDLAELRVGNGLLSARTTGPDPAFFGPPMQARAGEFNVVVVRLKLGRLDGPPFDDLAQLFWRTSRLPESEASSARFKVRGDGQWHEYRVPVAANPRWRGVLTRLRLDPCNRANVMAELDSIRLSP